MTRTLFAATLALAVGGSAWAQDGPEAGAQDRDQVVAPSESIIDLAICLDTSGSMDGLIDAAKQKLWAIVNDLALAEPTPRLRVALLTFGNDGHNPENGWVNVDTPFTQDLDLVSEKLFKLTTNGGTELVARVLHHAGKLEWHPSDSALKLIVVAGNESAEQDGEMPFRDVCRATISRGIMINSIYCGPPSDNIAPAWREVALLADGQFASIDQNEGTIVVETPFDQELTALSASINTTYIAFGEDGQEGVAKQSAQDANAANQGLAVAAARCSTKGGALYRNAQWDLVDACEQENFDIATVAEEDLPENMQKMTKEERVRYVETKTQERADIQSRIASVSQQRAAYIEAEMKKNAIDDSRSFDTMVRKAIRAQAVAKGLRFPAYESVEKTDG